VTDEVRILRDACRPAGPRPARRRVAAPAGAPAS
jgi:hypothetical protein